jgi:hypothetical protein
MQRKQSVSLSKAPFAASPSTSIADLSNNSAIRAPEILKQLDDLWNNQNFGVIDNLFSKDVVSINPLGNTIGSTDFKTYVKNRL